ncbi:glycosyltransferase family 9 protein [Cloacibacillus evryensis]|uniref:glycosyltransferase family 9 protein n=1 Tax=Cloacibacillus evryensis TaxID=508460 RepID=UPI00241E86A0|nr:glycosyltransferase family 9 protein [Cloacibacillus evryensis]
MVTATNFKRKVLFLRFSSLGDVIFANYTAMRIKEKNPDFHLTWMVDSLYADIVRAQPWVDSVKIWDRKKTKNRGYIAILRQVRHEGFDILVDMHASDRTSLFSLLCGIPVRYGCKKRFPFTHTHFLFDDLMDTSLSIGTCKRYLYAAKTYNEAVRIFTPDGSRAIGLAIGASYPIKRWTVNRWIEFCQFAVAKKNYTVLLGNGADEVEMAENIESAVPSEYIINKVGCLSITDTIMLIDRLDLIVSGDTGLMHAARALGKPVVGLFGPNFPGVGAEYLDSLGEKYVCKCPHVGCERQTCSRQCLNDIAAEDVFSGVEGLLSAG